MSCAAPDSVTPTIETGGSPFGPGLAGGSGSNSSEALLGTWERFDVFDAGDDIVTQTTTWQFAEEGFCRRTISSFSANEGVVRTETRDCSFAVASGQITITLSASAPATYRYSFAGFSPDRLVLDDLEYRRVA